MGQYEYKHCAMYIYTYKEDEIDRWIDRFWNIGIYSMGYN